MLSARQLLLMRRARDRAICMAVAPIGAVALLPDPDFRRRVFRRVSHVGLASPWLDWPMDRMASVGCPIRLWRCHVYTAAAQLEYPTNSRRLMRVDAAQREGIGSSLHLGSGHSRSQTSA